MNPWIDPEYAKKLQAMQGMQGVAQQVPPLEMPQGSGVSEDVPEQPSPVAPPPVMLSPLERAQADYTNAVSAPVQKQKGWKQGLYMGLQALQRIGDRMDGIQSNQPFTWLGNDIKQKNVDQKGRVLAPLQAQADFKMGQKAKQAQIDTIKRDDERGDAELKRKQDKDYATTEYWKRKADTADFRAMTDADLAEMKKWAIEQNDKNAKRRLDTIDKEIEERTRHNKESETIQREGIKSREGIAEANRGVRQDIAVSTQMGQNYRAQARNKQQAAATIAALRAKGATEDVIQQYISNLDPSARP